MSLCWREHHVGAVLWRSTDARNCRNRSNVKGTNQGSKSLKPFPKPSPIFLTSPPTVKANSEHPRVALTAGGIW